MPKADLRIDSATVGSIAFEIQDIRAQGGPDFPQLAVRLDLRLSAHKTFSQPAQPVYPLSCVFLSGDFCSPPERAVAVFRDEMELYAPEQSPPREQQIQLQIPLDIFTVGRIEQARSGDLRAALKFRFLLASHSQGAPGWVQRFRTANIEPIVFAIPKSQWIEQLLPGLGHGKLEIIEVRIPDGIRGEWLRQSVAEIRQAQKYLTEGEWDKAVTHCRMAIDAVPEARGPELPPARRFGTKVDTFIGEHLAGVVGEAQAKLVAVEMNSLWEVCSKAVHPATSDSFKRADAEFLVRTTMALVEYFGKLLS